MNRGDRHHTHTGPTESGCRHLAVRVIEQAFRDLTSAVGSHADQESARRFLAGSPMLSRWCEIATLSAAGTMARARVFEALSRRREVPDQS